MSNEINPSHYQGVHKGVEVQVADVMDIFELDRHQSQAVKYLLRAGKKPSSTYLKDMGKALWWCARAILARGGHIDLPPEASLSLICINGKSQAFEGRPKKRRAKK
jgi:hypothetical protein